MRVGIRVKCTVCHQTKAPHGRSTPLYGYYCDFECPGYNLDPKPGCLWPGETSEEFGFPFCNDATIETDN